MFEDAVKRRNKGARPLEIALYGKGGIGKSTVSANVSAALALTGKRVLQIGCDPKHDSTRALMGGQNIPTVLEYLRDTPKEQAVVDAVLHEGAFGVGCVEAGGPKPGVGCAGRGIISAFEFLDRNRVKDGYDTIVYDVLGDVVCGGFAVPIRSEYADAIFLVTSGEYMALYAANNILRGIRSYDGDERRRVAGIVFNARNLEDEHVRVERFAQAVGLPIVISIPRSPVFAEAERLNCTVMELDGPVPEQELFGQFASYIANGPALHAARPLTDEELERCILYGEGPGGRLPQASGAYDAAGDSAVAPAAQVHAAPGAVELAENDASAHELAHEREEAAQGEPDGRSSSHAAAKRALGAAFAGKPAAKRPPLYGCAFTGAATVAVHLTDAVVIAHSPRACAFYTWQNISSPGRKNLFHRGTLLPSAISPHYECTQIDQHEAVFGGIDKLRRHVQDALARNPGAVIVINSCVSGIIGDDVLSVERLSTPQTPVIVVPADGDIAGDYMAGIPMCLHAVAQKLVDPSVERRPRSINLIGETGVANDLEINFRIVEELLARMDVAVNCRFLGNATADEVRHLTAAPVSLLASEGQDNLELRAWLEQRFGLEFLDGGLPIGFDETERFLQKIGAYFDCAEKVEPIVAAEREQFERDLAALRPQLAGKRLLVTTINANLDWLLDAATAAGMQIVWVGVLNYLHRELGVTSDPRRQPLVESITSMPEVLARIEQHKPDIVVSNYAFNVPNGDYIVDSMPMVQQVGFHSGIQALSRWAHLQQNEPEGAWIHDKELFEKYFA